MRVCFSLSYLFDGVIFSFTSCAGVAQLVSGFFSERIVLCVAVSLVCLWEEVSSGASYVTVVNRNSVCTFLNGQGDQRASESLLPVALW